MLGILVGTDDGLLEIVPGEEPRRALEGLPVTSLDYRDGYAVAGTAGHGVYAHLSDAWRQIARTSGEGWERVWSGDACCVRAAPGGEVYIGADPPALFVSFPGSRGGGNELGALRGALQAEREPSGATAGGHPRVVAVTFADGGPEHGLFVAVSGSGVWYAPDTGRDLTYERFEKRSSGLSSDLYGVWAHPERTERVFASTASGFYRSEDAGQTWVQSISGLDRSWAGSAVVLPGTPDTLMLACARRAPGVAGALFRSPNAGLTWTRTMLGDEDEWERPPLLARLWDSEDTVFTVAGDKLWGSHDAGRNWVALSEGLPPARALAAAL
jgi:hypothetical protein